MPRRTRSSLGRLTTEAKRARLRRQNETTEKREIRLSLNRKRTKSNISNETPEQREDRQARDRARHANRKVKGREARLAQQRVCLKEASCRTAEILLEGEGSLRTGKIIKEGEDCHRTAQIVEKRELSHRAAKLIEKKEVYHRTAEILQENKGSHNHDRQKNSHHLIPLVVLYVIKEERN